MRILFASIHNYLDPSSGAAISMRTTLQTLADSGAKVRVFCGDRFDFDRYDDATLPSPIKLGCNDCRVKKCSTTINSDYAVYHRVSPDIGFMPVGSLSGFIYDGSSGGSSDFYIIPINNSIS